MEGVYVFDYIYELLCAQMSGVNEERRDCGGAFLSCRWALVVLFH